LTPPYLSMLIPEFAISTFSISPSDITVPLPYLPTQPTYVSHPPTQDFPHPSLCICNVATSLHRSSRLPVRVPSNCIPKRTMLGTVFHTCSANILDMVVRYLAHTPDRACTSSSLAPETTGWGEVGVGPLSALGIVRVLVGSFSEKVKVWRLDGNKM
jgi:hypothetical protein